MFSNYNARANNSLRSKATRCLPVTPPCLLGLCLTLLSSSLVADTVTDSFECVLGPESRTIELTFLDNVGAVPCEIRETREDGQTRALWRANNDVSFCHRQMTVHRSRLHSFGWTCNSDTADALTSTSDSLSTRALKSTLKTRETQSSFIQANRPNNQTRIDSINALNTTITQDLAKKAPSTQKSVTGALVTSTVSLSTANDGSVIAGQLVPIAPQDREVTVFEDRSTPIAKSSGKPSPPEVSAQEFNGDDIRQIDDWLMYLSAQSMASIRSIIGDRESFNDYQLAEAQNSDNIYSRLQHRIEFLQSLLEER